MKALAWIARLALNVHYLGWRRGFCYWRLQWRMTDPAKCRAFIARLRASAAVSSDPMEQTVFCAFADETERRLNIIEGRK